MNQGHRIVGTVGIHWRRLDRPGRDAARFWSWAGGWRLAGEADFRNANDRCHLRYVVDCDHRWRTRAATVEGSLGGRRVSIVIAADRQRRWRLDGEPQLVVDGCLDVDLAFTPATNLLPIRRLELAVGGSASVDAAWLTFPELGLERLRQRYARTGTTTYGYEVLTSSFRSTLTVTPSGLVAGYPGLWEAVRG
ncbi:MAG TPA: putative glycolipid-binding domain-containing protein [Thermoanaerobaculia bacterium]|nr:putative glycolipid-binding domain-containing protein [Thermoanaerobaculia bacterium]